MRANSFREIRIGRASLLIVVAALLLAGLWYWSRQTEAPVGGRLNAVAAASGDADPRWARVTEPRTFSFPSDHGSHPEYQIEWWYYTGNLEDANGRPFGFQLTFFRRGLHPTPATRESRWAARNIYLAHFTISDIERKQFYAAERFSRDGAGLAGATGVPFRVWLDPWQASGSGTEGMTMRLQADAAKHALDLQLESTKSPTLQGDRGYSVKGGGVGNASYYYSLTRMRTNGTLRVGDESFTIVGGTSWMDHEWGTSRLEEGATGWDWFALQLDDGRELTWAQLRGAAPGEAKGRFGTITAADGSTVSLAADDLMLDVVDSWTSPRTGARYPAAWRLRSERAGIDLRVRPRMPDQELPVSIVYWEGAVAVEGETTAADGSSTPVSGYGYVELTGYDQRSGRPIGR